ncbi:hypothetical protein ASPACDRAFT_76669 [Aspergillus aculeatus ATCC 16872]|uniref:Uncharacterized protein n=1 Tax=Aspergillus aculeatus (strain ATCC 16872 / CBS 172.66 / WB 5094) TaxID=690307 RepID=A0A1L9X1I6_ASPA1|nr:uncharacterized protein ASPACDRAFT_76669 [Aspergillus aculeatus ATCC 16872]OJK02301.1 hypothetical protein ASPACDRAFT_76669 [Aspergillus aculeatus ATCC 16872]
MSLGRHAYRHAVHPASSSSGFIDHVWISDDLLASTFRSFVKSQRRHASRVPGPLEARRRLAKRKNCAFAPVTCALPPDPHLFGRGGRQHLLWNSDHAPASSPLFSPYDNPHLVEPDHGEHTRAATTRIIGHELQSGVSHYDLHPPRAPIAPLSDENGTLDPGGFVDLGSSSEAVPPPPPPLPSPSSLPADGKLDDTGGFVDLTSLADSEPGLEPGSSGRDVEDSDLGGYVDPADSFYTSLSQPRGGEVNKPGTYVDSSAEPASSHPDSDMVDSSGFEDLVSSSASSPKRSKRDLSHLVDPNGLLIDVARFSDASLSPRDPVVTDQNGFVELNGLSEPADDSKVLPSKEILTKRLETCSSLEAVTNLINAMGINLQHEPGYSRIVFDHYFSQLALGKSNAQELSLFLDHRALNTPGAGAFPVVAKYIIQPATDSRERTVLFASMLRAIRVGAIVPSELREVIGILQKLPDVVVTTTNRPTAETQHNSPSGVMEAYQKICDVLDSTAKGGKYPSLDEDTANLWLKIIWERNVLAELRLAHRILARARHLRSTCAFWGPRFIIRWLGLQDELRSEIVPSFTTLLFQRFHYNAVGATIISVTEYLVLAQKQHLLPRWHDCLTSIRTVRDIPKAGAWVDARSQIPSGSSHSGLSVQQRFLLRLWVFRALNLSHAAGPTWDKKPHMIGIRHLIHSDHVRPIEKWGARVLSLYQACRTNHKKKDLVSSLLDDARELELPANGITILALSYQTRNALNKTTRAALQALETSDVSFNDLFRDFDTPYTLLLQFARAFSKIAREIDIESPSFMERALELARIGNRSEVQLLFRIFDWHVPLKIALARSWQPPPDPSHHALVVYEPRDSRKHPDPHAALNMINTFAVALSCSQNLTPRQSYRLICWLYVYLMRHQAPVQPIIVRAMYHAGVVRARREMRGMFCEAQFKYIMQKVQQVESPEVVRALSNPNFVWRNEGSDSVAGN